MTASAETGTETTTPAETATDTAMADTTASEPAATMTESKHVIVSGDTLWDLAETAYGDGHMWKKISAANGDPRPRALAIGSELTIPAK